MSSWQDDARSRLVRAGQRVGAARAEVIQYLGSQSCCRGAQEIHEALSSRGSRIGLASVYRAVDSLVDCGAVVRIDVGDGVARYEPVRSGAGHHHHLVCDGCGKLEPFHDARLEQAIEAVELGTGYAVATHEVVLRGACGDCRAD
jgi:Fur family ferric uptake transcriptional regulator